MPKEKKVSIKVNWDLDKAGKARYKDDGYKMFYTLVLKGKKRLKGEVKEMAPKDFLASAGAIDRITDNLDAFAQKVKEGRKISIPVLDLIHDKRIGIEAALACKELGVDKMPVLVCGKPKETKKK